MPGSVSARGRRLLATPRASRSKLPDRSPHLVKAAHAPRSLSHAARLLGGLTALLLAISPATTSAQVSQDAALSVEGLLAEYTVQPGQVVTHTMKISLGRKAVDSLDMLVDVLGLGETPDGAVIGLQPDADTNAYSARAFIQRIDP